MEILLIFEQCVEIEEWFQVLVDCYLDFEVIEVVNEFLYDLFIVGSGNYIEVLGGNGSIGWDWILEFFCLVWEYFLGVEFMFNDYNIVNSVSNIQEYIEIIELLQVENFIDQIGVQVYVFFMGGSVVNMISNIESLSEIGFLVYIIELDIDGEID